MKYRADTVTIEGQTKWAVFSGKKYFIHTVTDSKKDAEQQAIVRSAIWHQQQIDKLSDKFGVVNGSELREWIC